jgi:sugar lactone lactonase YvrE
MTTRVGQGEYRYEVISDWAKLPDGWSLGWIPSVGVDSRDRVIVSSRSEHTLIIFDTDGNVIESWDETVLVPENAHGIYIDGEDNIYLTEWLGHCVYKFSPGGELQWTLGTPGVPRPPGVPFNRPTDLAIAPDGCLFVSDGYVNHKVHKFSPEGVLIKSWGEPGSGPGQFDLVHSVWIDSDYRVYICDRENNRIQLFDAEGEYLDEWTGFLRPDKLWFDSDETIFMAEIGPRVTILDRQGSVLSQWGEAGDEPHQFKSFPHGIWGDSRGDLYVIEVAADGLIKKFVRVRDELVAD